MKLTSEKKFKLKIIIFIGTLMFAFILFATTIIRHDQKEAQIKSAHEDDAEEAKATQTIDQDAYKLDQAKKAKATALLQIEELTYKQEVNHTGPSRRASYSDFYKLDPYAKPIVVIKMKSMKWNENHTLVCITKDKSWTNYGCYSPNQVRFE